MINTVPRTSLRSTVIETVVVIAFSVGVLAIVLTIIIELAGG